MLSRHLDKEQAVCCKSILEQLHPGNYVTWAYQDIGGVYPIGMVTERQDDRVLVNWIVKPSGWNAVPDQMWVCNFEGLIRISKTEALLHTLCDMGINTE